MLRKINWLKILGNFFILIVLAAVSFVYFVFVFIVNIKHFEEFHNVSLLRIIYLLLFHLCFFMLIWSFIQTMITDPGRVPIHWGFHMDDTEVKKKRYCLICHIFKPERCHHCSLCNRCVLNMDHHCPWINNCVGFQNRKFFILLLFYTYICILLVFAGMIQSVYYSVIEIATRHFKEGISSDILTLLAFTLTSVLLVLLGFFFRYHLKLLFSNITTIEDLERKRSNVSVNFNIGARNNFEQVFGKNPWLWPFPTFGESGKPIGDGVTWDRPLVNA